MGLGFGGSAIEAARAFIRVIADNRDAMKNLKNLERRYTRFARRIEQLGQAVASAFAARQASRFLAFTAEAAGNVEVIQRRFQLIFGNLSKDAEASAQAFSNAWQSSVTRVREQFARLRALFTPFLNVGASQTDVLRLTQLTSGAIAQFAAATGLGLQEAQDRIISGITSTGEALDQFGINVRKAAVSQELLALGINKTILNATEEEKVLAKISIIMRSIRDQNIKVTDTLGLFNVQVSRLKDNFIELAAAIGDQFLPALASIIQGLNNMMRSMTKFLKANPFVAKILAGGLVVLTFLLGAIAALTAIAFIIPTVAGALGAVIAFPAVSAAVGATAVGAAAFAVTEPTATTGTITNVGVYSPGMNPLIHQGDTTAEQTEETLPSAAEAALEGAGQIAGIAGGAGPRVAESLRFGGGGLSLQQQTVGKLENIEQILNQIEQNQGEGAEL